MPVPGGTVRDRENRMLALFMPNLSVAVRGMRDALRVAGDGGKLRPHAQLSLQIEDPLVVVFPGNIWRQVIRQHADTPQRRYDERCFRQYRLEPLCRKYAQLASIERFICPLSGEATFGSLD